MTYIPIPLAISNITNAYPGVVTTTDIHNLADGQLVKILCPQPFGMSQINKQLVGVKVLSSNTFSMHLRMAPELVALDTNGYDAFVLASGNLRQIAVVVPIGSTPIQSVFQPVQIFETILNDQVRNIKV